MGGPVGVYDADDYPFLHSEMDWLRARLAADLPTLGICLGAQLIAGALGAKVFPGPVPEVGWDKIVLADGAQQHPIAELTKRNSTVLHWHNDTFDLPVGARLLASTPLYRNQAFAIGKRGLALQFHVEVEPICLEQWLIGFTGDIRRLGPKKIRELRANSEREAPGLQVRAEAFFRRWLDFTALQERAA
jgi:GMP synthase (glutamine-hydrolysing)